MKRRISRNEDDDHHTEKNKRTKTDNDDEYQQDILLIEQEKERMDNEIKQIVKRKEIADSKIEELKQRRMKHLSKQPIAIDMKMLPIDCILNILRFYELPLYRIAYEFGTRSYGRFLCPTEFQIVAKRLFGYFPRINRTIYTIFSCISMSDKYTVSHIRKRDVEISRDAMNRLVNSLITVRSIESLDLPYWHKSFLFDFVPKKAKVTSLNNISLSSEHKQFSVEVLIDGRSIAIAVNETQTMEELFQIIRQNLPEKNKDNQFVLYWSLYELEFSEFKVLAPSSNPIYMELNDIYSSWSLKVEYIPDDMRHIKRLYLSEKSYLCNDYMRLNMRYFNYGFLLACNRVRELSLTNTLLRDFTIFPELRKLKINNQLSYKDNNNEEYRLEECIHLVDLFISEEEDYFSKLDQIALLPKLNKLNLDINEPTLNLNPNLTDLSLFLGSNILESSIQAIMELKHMVSIELTGNVSPQFVPMNTLNKLMITSEPFWTSGAESLVQNRSIRQFASHDNYHSILPLFTLKHSFLKQLGSLELSDVSEVIIDRIISDCHQNLTQLRLFRKSENCAYISTDSMKKICQLLPKLTTLVCHNIKVESEGAVFAFHNSTLKHLEINYHGMNSSSWNDLKLCTNLKSLKLSDVPEDIFIHLLQRKTLKKLNISLPSSIKRASIQLLQAIEKCTIQSLRIKNLKNRDEMYKYGQHIPQFNV
jgi:hypothetical protein